MLNPPRSDLPQVELGRAHILLHHKCRQLAQQLVRHFIRHHRRRVVDQDLGPVRVYRYRPRPHRLDPSLEEIAHQRRLHGYYGGVVVPLWE